MQSILQPINSSDRIRSLDFIRGIAILSILLINIEDFCYPDPWSPYKYGFTTYSDKLARFWIYFLTQGKSYSMLALLFGVGFYIFIERFEKKGGGTKAFDLYGKRLLWLFLFGTIHAYVIWDGDILHHYAACGLIFFPFRSFKSGTLVLLLLIPISLLIINSYVSVRGTEARYQQYLQTKSLDSITLSPEVQKKNSDWEKETTEGSADTSKIEAPRKTYLENIAANTEHVKIHLGRIYNQGIFYRTLIMMIIGILLYRSGAFVNYKSIRFYWPITFFILVLALIVNYLRHYHWSFESFIPVTNFWQECLYTFPKELLGLAYVLFFNGLYQAFFKFSRANFISNIGRTALSNYILQSILCSLLFYGYGFAMYNQFSRLELLKVVAVIWGLQLGLSWIWLKKFNYGPLEWLWRKLTYGNLNKSE